MVYIIIIGFLVGLFLPSPIDAKIKSWILALYHKIFKKKTDVA